MTIWVCYNKSNRTIIKTISGKPKNDNIVLSFPKYWSKIDKKIKDSLNEKATFLFFLIKLWNLLNKELSDLKWVFSNTPCLYPKLDFTKNNQEEIEKEIENRIHQEILSLLDTIKEIEIIENDENSIFEELKRISWLIEIFRKKVIPDNDKELSKVSSEIKQLTNILENQTQALKQLEHTKVYLASIIDGEKTDWNTDTNQPERDIFRKVKDIVERVQWYESNIIELKEKLENNQLHLQRANNNKRRAIWKIRKQNNIKINKQREKKYGDRINELKEEIEKIEKDIEAMKKRKEGFENLILRMFQEDIETLTSEIDKLKWTIPSNKKTIQVLEEEKQTLWNRSEYTWWNKKEIKAWINTEKSLEENISTLKSELDDILNPFEEELKKLEDLEKDTPLDWPNLELKEKLEKITDEGYELLTKIERVKERMNLFHIKTFFKRSFESTYPKTNFKNTINESNVFELLKDYIEKALVKWKSKRYQGLVTNKINRILYP